MKKFSLLSVALCIVFAMSALTACGGNGNKGNSKEFTWAGLDNVTVAAGDEYDLLEGVTVKDTAGKDITSSLKVLTEEDEEALTELNAYEDFEEFNYHYTGVYTVYYSATSGDKTEYKSREITVTQQHNVANGDFAETNNTGFYGWTFDSRADAQLEEVTEGGKVKPKFNITSLGNAWWALQYFSQANLKSGETYKITIRAKSTNGKSVAFGFEDVANNYAMLQGLTAFTLTADYADYVSYYTANADYINAKAVIYLGYMLEEDTSAAYDITIDSVKVEKIEKCPEVTFTGLDKLTFNGNSDELKNFDPMAGVTAKNGETDLTSKIKIHGGLAKDVMADTDFTLAYVVENENGPTAIGYRTIKVKVFKENPYDVKNGNFESSIDNWTVDINPDNPGPSGAKMEWVAGDDNEGAMKVTITTPTGDPWRIQTFQDITVEAGVHYVATIRAKADRERTIQMEIKDPVGTMALTTEYKEFKFYYIAATSGNIRFNIQMGGGGSDNNGSVIYIDSAKMELDEDQTDYEPYQMVNPNFDYGMKNWGYEGAEFTEGEDTNGHYVQATLKNQTDAEGWRIQLRQDGKTFDGSKTYKVIVKIKASVARDITLEVTGDVKKSTTLHLTTEIQTLEFTFSPDEDKTYTDTRVGMLLGGANIEGQTITVYQFEIVEVEADA